jgi:hypothetical protein
VKPGAKHPVWKTQSLGLKNPIMPFKSILAQHDLKLVRRATATLQINLGFLYNQTCRHCHLNAGPGRTKENIDGKTLKALNVRGYDRDGSGLELNLVSNPSGAFMPPNQEQIEKRYHQILEQKWGLTVHRLFNFANVLLGRFKHWLIQTGNYDGYLQKLVAAFNPCAIEGLMCAIRFLRL